MSPRFSARMARVTAAFTSAVRRTEGALILSETLIRAARDRDERLDPIRVALERAREELKALCGVLFQLRQAMSQPMSSGPSCLPTAGGGLKQAALSVGDPVHLRRLAALLAWLDVAHNITLEVVDFEPPFFVDTVHLDAYAKSLDSTAWQATRHAGGRELYRGLAQKILDSLCAPVTTEHMERVRTHEGTWET
jgi:hypothetical protein